MAIQTKTLTKKERKAEELAAKGAEMDALQNLIGSKVDATWQELSFLIRSSSLRPTEAVECLRDAFFNAIAQVGIDFGMDREEYLTIAEESFDAMSMTEEEIAKANEGYEDEAGELDEDEPLVVESASTVVRSFEMIPNTNSSVFVPPGATLISVSPPNLTDPPFVEQADEQ